MPKGERCSLTFFKKKFLNLTSPLESLEHAHGPAIQYTAAARACIPSSVRAVGSRAARLPRKPHHACGSRTTTATRRDNGVRSSLPRHKHDARVYMVTYAVVVIVARLLLCSVACAA